MPFSLFSKEVADVNRISSWTNSYVGPSCVRLWNWLWLSLFAGHVIASDRCLIFYNEFVLGPSILIPMSRSNCPDACETSEIGFAHFLFFFGWMNLPVFQRCTWGLSFLFNRQGFITLSIKKSFRAYLFEGVSYEKIGRVGISSTGVKLCL